MLLVFDLDGTLIDSRRDLCTGINLMRQYYGLTPLPLEIVSGYVGDGVRTLVSRALQGEVGIDLDEAVQKNSEFYRAHLHDETTLYPGVADGLQKFYDAGHTLALLSNKPLQPCQRLLAHFKLDKLFKLVMGGDNAPYLKPHPGGLEAIMRDLNFKPENTWMIGDSANDLACARQAGVRAVFVTYGIGQATPETPELQCASFMELTRLLLRSHESA